MSAWTRGIRRGQPAERLALQRAAASCGTRTAPADRRRPGARRPRSRRSRGGRAGGVPVLKRPSREPERGERRRKARAPPSRRRGLPAVRRVPRVHQAVQKRSRRHDDRVRPIALARRGDRARDAAAARRRGSRPFPRAASGSRVASRRARGEPGVERPVALRARPPDRRAAGAVEDPELDAGGVGEPAHHAPERVDLADELPLGEARRSRGCRTSARSRERARQKRRATAHARRGVRRLDARVAAADDEDVVTARRSLSLTSTSAETLSADSLPRGRGYDGAIEGSPRVATAATCRCRRSRRVARARPPTSSRR